DEWHRAAAAPPPDVPDAEAAIGGYREMADRFVAGFHEQIAGLMEADPGTLPAIDVFFHQRDFAEFQDRETLERLFVPTLGAYLGLLLVNFLDGRWVPRRELDEVQVVVGGRAWLPFLRVRRYLHSRQSVRDRSLTQFYREAERHTVHPDP
ncbi:MAG TPA: hypothetical protein VNP72_11590, partial [Longimicrobium sp.]|nr:hypothetical protein [Longimicrobium sp.]